MKFTDGNWLVKDGFDLIPGDQLFTTDHDSRSLTLTLRREVFPSEVDSWTCRCSR